MSLRDGQVFLDKRTEDGIIILSFERDFAHSKGETNMKKSVMRVLALAICLVMVLAMVPAKARAVELDKNSMPLLESISVDE